MERSETGSGQPKTFQKGSRMIGIFELANLFGITTMALRKYEDKKILQPYRDESGYRKYLSWEVTKIIRARQLLGEGLSLQDIAAEMTQGDPERQLRDMEALEERLAGEIAYRERLIRWLRTRREEIIGAEELGEKCAIERQSPRCCCVYMVEDTLVDKKGQEWDWLKEWVQALPFARVCYVGTSVEHMYSCLSLRQEELELYGLKHLKPDFILSEQACAVCNVVAEHTQTRDTSVECIIAARERAQKLGGKLADLTMVEMVRYTQQGDMFRSYNKAMFPLIEEK